jgi:hypothetical protein
LGTAGSRGCVHRWSGLFWKKGQKENKNKKIQGCPNKEIMTSMRRQRTKRNEKGRCAVQNRHGRYQNGHWGWKWSWKRNTTPTWFNGPGWYNTVFINKDPDLPGFQGLHVARVRLFFDFHYAGRRHQCALVEWFIPRDVQPCNLTGMWVVSPEMVRGKHVTSVVHLDTILCGAYLIGEYGRDPLPSHFHCHDSLNTFQSYYVNKFANHHSNEIAF